MTGKERDAWAEETLKRIQLHRRRDFAGMFSMLDDGLLDVFDAMAVAPFLLSGQRQAMRMVDYERQRLAWLEAYRAGDCYGGNELDLFREEGEAKPEKAGVGSC